MARNKERLCRDIAAESWMEVGILKLLAGFPSVPYRLVVCLDEYGVVRAVVPVTDLCSIGHRMETVFHEPRHEVLDAVVHFGNPRLAEGALHAECDDFCRLAEVAGDLVLVHDLLGVLSQRGGAEAQQREQHQDSEQHGKLPFWLRQSQPSVHTVRYKSYFVTIRKTRKQEEE